MKNSEKTQTKMHLDMRRQTKLKHIDACLCDESQYTKSAGFDAVNLPHNSATQLSMADVSLTTRFCGMNLRAPIMIAPMTGGVEMGAVLNQRWARAANHFGIAFSVGSQRLALEDPSVRKSFMVRHLLSDTLLFANLGAAQLRMRGGVERAEKAVDMIEADALFIHLNPVQEACQDGGDTDFSGTLRAIEETVCRLQKRNIFVFVREVGFGLSRSAVRSLLNTGIFGIDCAGAGGTSWAKVESMCARSESMARVAAVFGEWGIPTAEAIKNVRRESKDIPLIATGGIRNGLDVAKALALGAHMASLARPFLQAAVTGEAQLFARIEEILLELRIALFACGVKTPDQLTACDLEHKESFVGEST